MNDFTLFSQTPCTTLDKIRSKGISENSNYIQNLEIACKNKNQPSPKTANNKLIKIAGIAALVLGLGTAIFLIKKK